MSETCYRAANALGRLVLRILGVRVHVTGAEHLPTSGPVLLAVTHSSFLDFVLLEKAAITRGRYVRFLTRHDIWRWSVLAWAMDAMRHVPVDREAPAAAYLTARRLLREGEAVGVFPEAGVSHSFTVRALMRGTAGLARETGAQVVPVALWGGQRIVTVGRVDLRRGRRVDVSLGEPMRIGPDEDLTEGTRGLGARLTRLLEEIQDRPHHRPRPEERAPWHPAHLGGAAPTRLEAAELDSVPRSAVPPTWGPPA